MDTPNGFPADDEWGVVTSGADAVNLPKVRAVSRWRKFFFSAGGFTHVVWMPRAGSVAALGKGERRGAHSLVA